MSEGWICLHRGWRDNPLFKGEFSRADAWVWMIEAACWKPARTRIKGETVELQRGELSFSQRFLAEKWGWTKSRVDRFIADLRSENMIKTRSKNGASAGQQAGQGQSIITICNYAKYQDAADQQRGNGVEENGASAGQARGKEEQGNKETIEQGEEAKASPPRRARKTKPKIGMTDDWVPEKLPDHISNLIAQWPPGRLEREIYEFRSYWKQRGEKRPGWEATFSSRVNDVHERIMRDSRHDGRNANWASNGAGDRRSTAARVCDDLLGEL